MAGDKDDRLEAIMIRYREDRIVSLGYGYVTLPLNVSPDLGFGA